MFINVAKRQKVDNKLKGPKTDPWGMQLQIGQYWAQFFFNCTNWVQPDRHNLNQVRKPIIPLQSLWKILWEIGLRTKLTSTDTRILNSPESATISKSLVILIQTTIQTFHFKLP